MPWWAIILCIIAAVPLSFVVAHGWCYLLFSDYREKFDSRK